MKAEEGISGQTMRGRARSTRTILTASLRADRRRTITSVVLDVSVGLSAPLLAVTTGMLVDAVVRQDAGARVVVAVVAMATCTSVMLGLSVVADRVRIRLEENVAHHVELDVMSMVTDLPGVSHHEDPAHLHRIDRLLEESWLVAMAVPAALLTMEAMVRFGFTLAVLASVDGRLALMPIAIIPTLAAGVLAERIRLVALDKRAEHGRRADDIFRLSMDRPNAAELRTFGAARHLAERYAAAHAVVERDERDHRMRGAWWLAAGRLVFSMAFGLGLVAVGHGAVAGTISPGQVVMVVGLTAQALGDASSLSGRLNWINWALTGVRHYVWLLAYDTAHRSDDAERVPPQSLRRGIRFEGVRFRYPGTERWVLDGFDLEIPAGSVVAIVGDNGAGKSTVVKLLLRLYEPTEGTITFDGADIAEMNLAAWRSRVTSALQDHTRPELLIGEAIGIGELARLEDAGALTVAAARSGSDAVIDEVPGGAAAQLGPEWPGGTDLSGGQWQRLAVGRSAMRDEPLLLILDEPTAALDPTAEHALFTHYAGDPHAARRDIGSATVVISHRLSTVRMADLIVVLAAGRIVERGTHDELLAADGSYAALFRLQAASYG